MSPIGFRALERKGKDLYDKMIEGALADEYTPFPDISRPGKRYRAVVEDVDHPRLAPDQKRMMEMAGVPTEQYRGVTVIPPGVSANAPPAYYNLVHKEGKAIWCMINFADRDPLASDRTHWSDLMAASCACAMGREHITGGGHRRDMSALLAVCRLNIVNHVTRDLVQKLAAERDLQPGDVFTLRPGDADFFSLLGTQNGKGIAWMLGTYPSKFGRKVITSALVTCSKPTSAGC
jgi:hypothetical protein